MTEGTRSRDEGGLFDAIDSKLTVFALANGMDLSKGEDYRRLEWFTEGLERGILVRRGEGESFDLTVMAWKTGHTEARSESPADAGLPEADVSGALLGAIETANALGEPS